MAFTFKINSASIGKVEESTKKLFEKVISNRKMLNEIAETIIDDVKFQTRKGKSIPNDGSFKPLTQDWKDMRKRISRKTETHASFSPSKSNLTITGQLLNAFVHKIIGAGKINFFFEGTHKPYKAEGSEGSILTIGKKIENEKLAKYVAEERPFIGVRTQIERTLKNIIVSYIRKS